MFPTTPPSGSLVASCMSQLSLQHTCPVHQVAAMLNTSSSTSEARNLGVLYNPCLGWCLLFQHSIQIHLFQIFHFSETKLVPHSIFVNKVLLKHNNAHYTLAMAASLLQQKVKHLKHNTICSYCLTLCIKLCWPLF